MSNIERKFNIFIDAVPSRNSKDYDSFENEINNSITPIRKKTLNKLFEKARLSLEAQDKSNCGFLTEKTLRHFLSEFNGRAWESGLHSMPYMFNIMEAYFNYNKPIIYFELIEEEDYFLSIYDYIDYITSNEFEESDDKILEHITDNIIYNFNITDSKSLTFKSHDENTFIINGISIIRRDEEIVVTLIAGRELLPEENIHFTGSLASTNNKDKEKIYKEYQENAEKGNIIYEFVDDDKKNMKVLAISRFSINDFSIDCNYVAEEYNKAFTIYTDDVSGFEIDENGKIADSKMLDFINKSFEIINKNNPVFEIAKLSLFLPYYFNVNEEKLEEENIETEFKKLVKNPLNKRKYSDTIGFKTTSKSFYKLNLINNLNLPDSFLLRDDFFKNSQKGIWRDFEDKEKIGLDRKGNAIKGKTWVTINESWHEYPKGYVIESKENIFSNSESGYIYMVRNPSFAENVFKIGLTRKDVNERVGQLSNTSVPDKFQIIKRWNVKNCVEAEKTIHKILDKYRINEKREFFHIQSEIAIDVIQKVIAEVNNKY